MESIVNSIRDPKSSEGTNNPLKLFEVRKYIRDGDNIYPADELDSHQKAAGEEINQNNDIDITNKEQEEISNQSNDNNNITNLEEVL